MPPARGQANPLVGWVFSVSEGAADFRFTAASVLIRRDVAMVTNRSSRKLEMSVPILAQDDFFAMRGKEHITYAIHAPRSLLAFMNCHDAILQKSGDAPCPVGAVRPAGLIEKITRSVSERSENRTTALPSNKLPLDRNSGCMRFPEHPFGNTTFQDGNWLPQKNYHIRSSGAKASSERFAISRALTGSATTPTQSSQFLVSLYDNSNTEPSGIQ